MILKLRYVIAATIATAALLSPTIASASNSSAHDGRRKLMPGSSIAQEVRNEHATGNSHPKFTLTGEVAGQSGNAFSIHVREPVPAVTSETTFSSFNGPKETVGNLGFTLLVADSDSDEEDGTIAIIAINDVTEEVNGIVQKKGQNMKFTQTKGNPAWAIEAEEFIPPAWACGVGSEEEAAGRRTLVEHGDHGDHDHDHEGHDHHDRESTEHTLAYLKENLRGSNIQMGKRRKLQSGGSYDFQVDVYIEVDQALVNDNGGIFNPNTINYVNSIFTGANTIYESEINTHLNILHITLNNNYDSSTSTSGALTTMRSIYSSQNFNYYDGPGRIDVHHALLSKSLGGGIAYLGVLCDSLYGFGLSASLSGQFASMDNAVVWDMMVVMHELGHNFNSGHTHNYPSPAIDTCGCSTDNTCSGSCPAELPLAKSSTIMSYCHLCSGGYNNMMYTFGGKYNGSGSRGTTSSYSNSNLQGTSVLSQGASMSTCGITSRVEELVSMSLLLIRIQLHLQLHCQRRCPPKLLPASPRMNLLPSQQGPRMHPPMSPQAHRLPVLLLVQPMYQPMSPQAHQLSLPTARPSITKGLAAANPIVSGSRRREEPAYSELQPLSPPPLLPLPVALLLLLRPDLLLLLQPHHPTLVL